MKITIHEKKNSNFSVTVIILKKVSGGIRTHDLSIIGSARYLCAITPSLYERILLWFIYAYGNFKTHFFRQWVAIQGKYFTVQPFRPNTIVCIGSHSKSR